MSNFLVNLVEVCEKVVHALNEFVILAVNLALDVLPEIIHGIESLA